MSVHCRLYHSNIIVLTDFDMCYVHYQYWEIFRINSPMNTCLHRIHFFTTQRFMLTWVFFWFLVVVWIVLVCCAVYFTFFRGNISVILCMIVFTSLLTVVQMWESFFLISVPLSELQALLRLRLIWLSKSCS